MINFSNILPKSASAIVLPLEEKTIHNRKLPSQLPRELRTIITQLKFTPKSGKLYPLQYGKNRFLICGLGNIDKLSRPRLCEIIKSAFSSDFVRDYSKIAILPPNQSNDFIKRIIEAWLIGTYSWDKYKSERDSQKKSLTILAKENQILQDCIAVCNGVNLARDLVNENADVKTSQFLEKKIRLVIRGKKDVKIEVLNKTQLKKKGLNLHLAVNQGSANEPKLIIIRYQGAEPKSPYTALVGKGITFDTGGLNLKLSGNIETMKMDMGGAAAVMGTLQNILALKPKCNIIFAVGLAENVIDAKAYKPGDVITGYAGKSVEIANTDAEGRLVLADAISYIVKNDNPKRIIDIATLTGACIIALGHDYSGLVSTDNVLANHLLQSADKTDDRLWRLPSYPELKESVQSNIADIRNLGYPKGAGGMLTAAEFLRQFTGKVTKWAHLDIAGTAYVEGKGRRYYNHGATGAGVRLLTHYFLNYA